MLRRMTGAKDIAVGVASRDVRSLEVRGFSAMKTIGLGFGIAGGLAAVAAAVAAVVIGSAYVIDCNVGDCDY